MRKHSLIAAMGRQERKWCTHPHYRGYIHKFNWGYITAAQAAEIAADNNKYWLKPDQRKEFIEGFLSIERHIEELRAEEVLTSGGIGAISLPYGPSPLTAALPAVLSMLALLQPDTAVLAEMRRMRCQKSE